MERDLIAGDASVVTDPTSGDLMTLTEAIQKGVVDGATARFLQIGKERSSVNLRQAIQMGLLENAYRKDSSEVLDRVSGEFVTLQEALRTKNVDLSREAVFDVAAKKRVSFTRAIETKLMDLKSFRYHDFTARDAARLGLISLPGAPVLATSNHNRRLTKIDLETGVASDKAATLTEKIRSMTLRAGRARQ